MSCWDCLKIFIPTKYPNIFPTYPLEELVIVNNNETTDKIKVRDWKAKNEFPKRKYQGSWSEIEDDEEELIYDKNTNIHNIQWEALSDTELIGNQKLKKRKKKNIKKNKPEILPTSDINNYTSDDSWDTSFE